MAGPRVCGIVLAAGAGTRFGGPKALARDDDGTPWLALAVRMLRAADCADVLVTLGAGVADAAALVPPDARIVVVPDWAEGLSATLRAGLAAAGDGAADAALITPVDTPSAPAAAAIRVLSLGESTRSRRDHTSFAHHDVSSRRVDAIATYEGADTSAVDGVAARVAATRAGLAQATYGGEPGHPVLIGADHFEAVIATLTGDRGAGRYLRARSALQVECGDLWSGADIDRR